MKLTYHSLGDIGRCAGALGVAVHVGLLHQVEQMHLLAGVGGPDDPHLAAFHRAGPVVVDLHRAKKKEKRIKQKLVHAIMFHLSETGFAQWNKTVREKGFPLTPT